MIAIDTNILVYSHRADGEFHDAAATAVRGIAEGSDVWAIPWPCLHEFFSVVTNPRIFREPTPLEKAIAQIEVWKESPALRFIGESAAYWGCLSEILSIGRIVGPKVHDARIAAICVSHGVRELWSADRDFSRMSGLRVRNPLTRAAG